MTARRAAAPKTPRPYVTHDPRLTIATLAAGPHKRYALTVLASGHVTFRAQRESKGWWLDTGARYVGRWQNGELDDVSDHWTVAPIFDAHPVSKLPSALEAMFTRMLRAATRKRG